MESCSVSGLTCSSVRPDGVIVDVHSSKRRPRWRARFIFGTVLAITSAACTSHPDVIHLPTAASPQISTVARCNSATASTVYEQLATAFNAGQIAVATAQFINGQHPGFTWWDPSDPSGATQDRTQLADHFRHMRDLGVRLPPTATFTASDDNSKGGFTFNKPHDGFYGKGGFDCTTGKLSYLVIDQWTKDIAGRAPVGTT
jgi:hypothetical protein